MAYNGRYASDGSMNVTVVAGTSYTGLYAADGSINVIASPGGSYVGRYHPCGAYYVTPVTDTSFHSSTAADGSMYVTNTGMPGKNQGNPITVVSGSLFTTTSTVSIDAISTVATAANAQTISINMTVGATANALLMSSHFDYSTHTGFGVTWTVGGVVQTLGVTPNFQFILTSDNGASAPAIALIGLVNPTPGAGTLTMAFTSATDNLVMQAVSFKNANTLGGLSTAFTSALFGTGTSASATISMPAIAGGIAMGFAGGVTSSPTTWNTGTQLYNASSGGPTWGSGVYQTVGSAGNFALGINASQFWAAAGVVVNPLNIFPTGTLSLNSSNPLTASLSFAIPCLGTGTLTDLVTSKTATTVGCTTDTTGGYGGGLAVPSGSTTAKADFGVWQPIPQGDFTIVAMANPTTTPAQGMLIGQCDTAVAGYACLQTNSSLGSSGTPGEMAGSAYNGATSLGADDNIRVVSAGTYHVGKIDGNYHTFALRVASGVPSLWCDGAKTSVDVSNLTGTYTNINQHFAIGNLGNYTGAAFSCGCTVVVAEGFSVALTDAQMASITSNPFQVYL